MLRKWFVLLIVLLVCPLSSYAMDTSRLLPAEQAFIPKIVVNDENIQVHFSIADGYYLYQEKIQLLTQPAQLVSSPQFIQQGKLKNDEFFGQQRVFYHQLDINWPYLHAAPSKQSYILTLSYQGCADAGICYPPVQTSWNIDTDGVFQPSESATVPIKNLLKLQSTSSVSKQNIQAEAIRELALDLSHHTLFASLLAFFIAGLGLSLTACLYPLLPIVSAIVVGQKQPSSKNRAFLLSFVYVQGLALTYTLVGIITASTGALLSAWLQQRAVILSAAGLLVILALSMFDLYSVQLPARWQSFFQQTSNRFRGGHWLSVFIMGALSALIIGPCVAPPLAFALGYIGQSGDVWMGGLALYALALGTGVPLMLVAVFGGHILPRAGQWMIGVKYIFGILLLAAAVYLATPFLPYALVIGAYTLLILIPAILLLRQAWHSVGRKKLFKYVTGWLLLLISLYFVIGSCLHITTPLHQLLTLTPPDKTHFGQRFTEPAELKLTMQQLLAQSPQKPVIVDFYADWCVSCKKMAVYTFNQPEVQKYINQQRLLQLDVTDNTPAQQAFLREYGLYGPPGLFLVTADGYISKPLLGFVQPEQLIHWYRTESEH